MARPAPGSASLTDQARITAYRVLAEADAGTRVNEALHQALATAALTDRDRRFVTELVMGATRMRGRLDNDLAACYRGRYASVESGVKRLLRLGAYQLRYMDAVPPHAALNTTVDLAQSVQLSRAAGLVNGVLRQLSRRPPLADPPADASPQALAAAYSHPEWMVTRWLARLSREQTISLLEWNNRPPTVWFRRRSGEAREGKLAELARAAELVLRPHARLSDYFHAEPSPAPLLKRDPLREGLFIIQDPSSGAVVEAVDPRPREVIIDLCAGPGGKTAALADRVGPGGRVLAFEIDRGRIDLLSHMLDRLGLDNVDIFPGDATSQPLPTADKVLLDVPCSGTGVISRRADLRWRRRPEHIVELAALQRSLLNHATRHLRPGGLLVYATCSLEPEENWELVRSFQRDNPQLSVAPMPPGVPQKWLDGHGALATFPPRDQVDGIFAVRLQSSAGSQGSPR